MLPRSVLFLLVAALAAGACDNGDVPTDPTPAPTVTDTFTGSLATNGAATHPFLVSSLKGGTVTATLKTVDPSTTPIGFSLGNWNGTSCQVVVANDAALQTSVLTGTTATPASLCLRVYDVGNIAAETTAAYTVEVVHP